MYSSPKRNCKLSINFHSFESRVRMQQEGNSLSVSGPTPGKNCPTPHLQMPTRQPVQLLMFTMVYTERQGKSIKLKLAILTSISVTDLLQN